MYKSFVTVMQLGLYIATGVKGDHLLFFIDAEVVKIFNVNHSGENTISSSSLLNPDHGCCIYFIWLVAWRGIVFGRML